MAWPDILIGAILLLTTLKGYKRGFIMELSGAVALALALVTPWLYNGAFDGAFERALHMSAAAAHVVAMFCVGVATYVAVLLAARALNAVAKLPVLGFGNALAGAAVGLFKGLVGIWVVLYVALFFPLTPSVRADLQRSALVGYITQPNAAIDAKIEATLPSFARGFLQPVFARHRV